MLGEDEARQVRLSTQNAGNLVALNDIPGANGLTWGEAFAAISSAPAKAVGLGGEIGSLQPGRRADVVIWNDDPLELSSQVESVWIDGVPPPLATRQELWRERYLGICRGGFPQARSH